MHSGVLLRVIGQGSLEEDSYPASVQLWIRDVSQIDKLRLPRDIKQRLKEFWSSCIPLVFLTGNQETGIDRSVRILVERIAERPQLFVFGAGHVGRNIALIGSILGFDVNLLDDRQEFLARDEAFHSMVKTSVVNFDALDKTIGLKLNRQASVVIVTRGHQCDEAILRQIAAYQPGYVGMIGSKRRVMAVFGRLKTEGVSESFLESVKAPIGLEIGAKSPQEIAVAILAQIIGHFSAAS